MAIEVIIKTNNMNLLQTFRRVGQQLRIGWKIELKVQEAQLPIIQKLYAKNGLELRETCSACPEQYDVYKDGKQVAYYRLRHGEFRVDYPECGFETIYTAQPSGDGMFDGGERLTYLTRAMRELLLKLKPDHCHN